MQERRERVLHALASGPISGPELAEKLDISRAAVWKHVETLRQGGFEIESTGKGYSLISIPEFGGPTIEFGLDTSYDVEYHDSIESTNKRARELATSGESNLVVVADEQTGGRGRLDREWTSPSGGIWLSIVLRPAIPPHHAPIYTLAGAVATTRAIRDVGVDAEIKWPNDVLCDEQKLVGILTEMEGEADRISWLVVGIGINANVDTEELPNERATSLRELVGDVNRRELTQKLLEAFHELTADREEIIPAWRELSSTLGKRVRIETPSETIVGKAVDIEFPGTLLVDTGAETKAVTAGDCEHLRPAD